MTIPESTPTFERTRKPRMADVAALAGVSHQTVSRVLNDSSAVRASTRERVLEAIAELGYRRNIAARALVTRSSRTIGVVTFGPELYGPASTLMGVESAAREAGYYVSLANMSTLDATSVHSAIDHFIDQGVDGLVVVTTSIEADDTFESLNLDIPMVVIAAGRTPRADEISVAVDQELGAQLAVEHLINQGHSEIVHVSGPMDSFDARARISGYRAAMRAASLEPRDIIKGDWTSEIGYEVGKKLLQSTLPTAIFASNDPIALGLIFALAEGGYNVPLDVSIVGFDDVPGAAFYRPPLTTLRQNFEELGRRCIETLLAAMQNSAPPQARPIRPELVVRASTAPPRKN
ncbi:MAG TPA: LacI family DNA-binding transcriptional regulator [Actinomycetales bacterium]|nr:LacI family DNA-binding transcriptional regulator [Actinomycetales bacterium]